METDQDHAFLYWFLQSKSFQKNIAYQPLSDNILLEQMRALANRDTLRDVRPSVKKTVVINENEKRKIWKGVTSSITSAQVKKLFSRGYLLSSNTANQKLDDPSEGWHIVESKHSGPVYFFSQPVIFRDGELCAFYYSYNCGELCGEGDLSIYRKTIWGWEHYIKISGWVS